MNFEVDVGTSINLLHTTGNAATGDCTVMVMPPQMYITLPDGSTPDFKFAEETGGTNYGY